MFDTDRCQRETPLHAFLDELQNSGELAGKPAPASQSLPRQSDPENRYFQCLSLQVSNSKMYFHDVLGGSVTKYAKFQEISEGLVK